VIETDSTGYLRWTSPKVLMTGNAAIFKTQKILGGHAIVSDMFDRWRDTNKPATTYPGAGIMAHRDGYNVLYGDWSAKWYGDPQQSIIYTPSTTNLAVGFLYSLGVNTIQDYFYTATSPAIPRGFSAGQIVMNGNAYGPDGKSSPAIWHRFDAQAGVDSGVTDNGPQ
jgi:hypothetical protein